ncbi:MAG: hypothetical protein EOO75_14470 [Myxococcales bacterium]|nr:MAG: hypothetical protein EOO75_14470 [Myxococcales bacterium]
MGRGTHIYAGRSRKVQLGTIRPGTSVALRSATPEGGGDCRSGRWYAVEPLGYVCDDVNVTTDLGVEVFRALASLAPREGEPLPFGYGYSTGAPMYDRLPTADEARKAERRYRPVEKLHRPKHPGGHMELSSTELPPVTGPVPDFLADHRSAPRTPWQPEGLVRKTIREGNLLSFQGVVEGEGGRRFLLATNLTVVPADRIWSFRPTSFHGVELAGEQRAPLGWTRRQPRPRHRRDGDRMVADGPAVPPRTVVYLTGQRAKVGGVEYVEARDGGWLQDEHLSQVAGKLDELPNGVDEGERWIDVGLAAGLLTVYQGREPVYSTLMSPGAGGTTQSAGLTIDQLLSGAFTPLGLYRMSFKYRSAVMTPEDTPEPEKTWIDDVPWVMYFRPPYAIHTAYWHEDFGHPKSGGCVNVSPLDAKYLFESSLPRVPDGWYGASNSLPDQPGTKIHLHR